MTLFGSADNQDAKTREAPNAHRIGRLHVLATMHHVCSSLSTDCVSCSYLRQVHTKQTPFIYARKGIPFRPQSFGAMASNSVAHVISQLGEYDTSNTSCYCSYFAIMESKSLTFTIFLHTGDDLYDAIDLECNKHNHGIELWLGKHQT